MDQIIIIEGPKEIDGVETFERVRVYARPVGRSFVRGALLNNWGRITVLLQSLEEEGAYYVQNVEWFIDLYPAPTPNPRSYFSYEKYSSLDEARAGQYGWFVRYALGEIEDVW